SNSLTDRHEHAFEHTNCDGHPDPYPYIHVNGNDDADADANEYTNFNVHGDAERDSDSVKRDRVRSNVDVPRACAGATWERVHLRVPDTQLGRVVRHHQPGRYEHVSLSWGHRRRSPLLSGRRLRDHSGSERESDGHLYGQCAADGSGLWVEP